MFQSKGDNSKDILAAQVPLAVIDASICWWISFYNKKQIY